MQWDKTSDLSAGTMEYDKIIDVLSNTFELCEEDCTGSCVECEEKAIKDAIECIWKLQELEEEAEELRKYQCGDAEECRWACEVC